MLYPGVVSAFGRFRDLESAGLMKQSFAYLALAGSFPGLPQKKGRRKNLRPCNGSGVARFESYFASDFES